MGCCLSDAAGERETPADANARIEDVHIDAVPVAKLSDGNIIPGGIALGLFRLSNEDAYNSVMSALKIGYRHIDTAAAYENEEAVGRAILDSSIPREQIFVTTKLNVFKDRYTYQETLNALNQSLQKLRLDYIDLYLIHMPWDDKNRVDQFKALIHAKEKGLVKSIGVSDYDVRHLQEIIDLQIKPAVLQIEIHPWLLERRSQVLGFCAQHRIAVESWGTLTVGKKFDDETIKRVVARNPGRTAAEVLVRWSLQKGFIPIVASKSAAHQKTNLTVAGMINQWKLSNTDMKELDSLSQDPYYTLGQDLSVDANPFPELLAQMSPRRDSSLGLST